MTLLDELTHLFAKATPEPWQAKQMNHVDSDPWFFVLDGDGRGPIVETISTKTIVQAKYLVTPEDEQRANVELIARLRTHGPQLVAIARAAHLGRTTILYPGSKKEFEGEWVAVPKVDFDALRTALKGIETVDA